MRLSALTLVSACVIAGISSTAEAKGEPVVLTPGSNWNVDFGATKCRLARTFGEGEDIHVLLIDQHYPSSGATLTVAGPSFRGFRNRKETYVALGDALEPFKTEPLTAELGSIRHGLVFPNIYFKQLQPVIARNGQKPPERASEQAGADAQVRTSPQLDTGFGAAVSYLSFRQRSREVRLDTGPLGEAFEVLNTCTRDMIRDWGFDVESQLAVVKGPVWTNQESVSRRIADRYPAKALRRGESAVLRMRVTIDTEGRVEDCVINEVTMTEALESPACEEMRRAEFEPAINAAGDPVRSFFTTSITYRIN